MFAPESKRHRRPAVGRAVEALEPRELLTLSVVTPLDLTEFVPFTGTVATFASGDIANPASATATISWGNIATTSGTIVADNNGYDVVTAPETFSIIDPSLPVTVTVVGSNGTLTATGTADIAESPLTPTTDQFSATAGEAFSGVVGSFLDNNPNGQPTDFAATINWGDSTVTSGTITPVGTTTPQRYEVSGVHTYASAGPENVSITVQRIAGGTPQSSVPATVTVNPPIQALSATSFTATANLAFNATVATFTAANLNDVAGNFSAAVNWGDSSTPTNATISPITGSPGQFAIIAGHTYTTAQLYTTSITVDLNAEPALSSRATGSINVAAGASPSAFAEPLTVAAGTPFTGLLGTFIDQADTTAADYSATFTTPNSTQTTASGLQITSEGNGLFEVNGTVTFGAVGTNSDKLTITPPQGAPPFSGTNTVTVIPAQYSAVGTPITATVGAPLTNVKVATFTDVTPGALPGGYTATITWGSGLTTTQGTIIADPSGSNMFDVEGSFTYTTPGPATATVTITRTVDGKMLTVSTPVTVNPANLVVSAVPPLTETAGLAFGDTTVATFTDNTNDPVGDYTASITWGTGLATTQGTIVADPTVPGQFDVLGAFTYPAAGAFNVSVTVSRTFPASQMATISTPVTVNPSPFSATGRSFSATVGVPLTNVPVASFTDTTTPITTAADYTATILWGTGLTTTQGNITGSNGTFTVSGNFIYASAGLNIATVTITRTSDSKTVTASTAVTVNPVNLVVSAVPPLTETASVAFNTTVATFTDNTSDPIGDYTATIMWGTGLATTQGTIIADPTVPLQFDVEGTFTYPTTGAFNVSVSVSRTFPASQTATASTAMTVVPAQLTAQGTTISPTAGSVFTGPVAMFSDSTLNTAPGSYTATINWGTGQATTQGVITGSGGMFTVSGSYTYTAAGSFPVTVTITRLAYPQTATATTAALVNGQLNLVPTQALTAMAGQQFSGQLVTLVDAQGGKASDFSATVNWGDGIITPGSVVTAIPTTTGATPYLAVVGTHTYMQTGNYAVGVVVTRTASGQQSAAAVPIQVFGFTAQVSPIRAQPGPNGALVTTEQEPTLSGTAQPGAAIALTFRRVGGGNPVALGETQANASGIWSLVVGPLGAQPIDVFAIVKPPNGPPTQSLPLFGGIPLAVLQHPVHFFKAVFGPARNVLKVTIARADATGPDPAGLTQAASYTFIGSDGRKSIPVAVSVAPLNSKRPMAHRSVTLKFAPSALSRRGALTLLVSFDGVANPGGSAVLRLG